MQVRIDTIYIHSDTEYKQGKEHPVGFTDHHEAHLQARVYSDGNTYPVHLEETLTDEEYAQLHAVLEAIRARVRTLITVGA